jgi:hypothetical protein
MPKTKTSEGVDDVIEGELEISKIIRWRKRQLVYAGFSMDNAERIAVDTRIDYHYAIDLLTSSGNEKLTMKIVL